MRALVFCGCCFFAASLAALTPDVLRSSGAVPPHIAGKCREPTGFQQSASGQYFVFDRRAHVVHGLDAQQASAWEIVHIGGEEGRIRNGRRLATPGLYEFDLPFQPS